MSGRDRLARVAWAIGGVLLGGVLGWWGGGMAACDPGEACEFRVASIDALGTWVGGVGTAAAVVIAAWHLNSELKHQRLASSRARELERRVARSLAQQIVVRSRPARPRDGQFEYIDFSVKNSTGHPLEDLEVSLVGSGTSLGSTRQLNDRREWAFAVRAKELGLPVLPADESRAGQVLNEHLRAQVSLRFSVYGRNFRRTGTGRDLVEDITPD